MSKIKLEAPFRQFRGKICKHSDIIFKEMYGETLPHKSATLVPNLTRKQS